MGVVRRLPRNQDSRPHPHPMAVGKHEGAARRSACRRVGGRALRCSSRRLPRSGFLIVRDARYRQQPAAAKADRRVVRSWSAAVAATGLACSARPGAGFAAVFGLGRRNSPAVVQMRSGRPGFVLPRRWHQRAEAERYAAYIASRPGAGRHLVRSSATAADHAIHVCAGHPGRRAPPAFVVRRSPSRARVHGPSPAPGRSPCP